MYPLSNNSLICFLISTKSCAGILYGLFDIGPVPGKSSIKNSMSLSGGMPGNSSGNTSGKSFTTGTSSCTTPDKEFNCVMLGACRDTYLILLPSGVVSKIVLLAHSMFPSYFDNPSMPNITSNPWDSNTIRSEGLEKMRIKDRVRSRRKHYTN